MRFSPPPRRGMPPPGQEERSVRFPSAPGTEAGMPSDTSFTVMIWGAVQRSRKAGGAGRPDEFPCAVRCPHLSVSPAVAARTGRGKSPAREVLGRGRCCFRSPAVPAVCVLMVCQLPGAACRRPSAIAPPCGEVLRRCRRRGPTRGRKPLCARVAQARSVARERACRSSSAGFTAVSLSSRQCAGVSSADRARLGDRLRVGSAEGCTAGRT